MTKTQKIEAGLKAMGWQESNSQPSRKYRRFSHRNLGRSLWLGKAGALRTGHLASKTIPVSEPALAKVLAAAE